MESLFPSPRQVWWVILLCAIMSTQASAQIDTTLGPDLDMDSLAEATSIYYQSTINSMKDPCTSDIRAEATVVNYEKNSMVEIYGDSGQEKVDLYQEDRFLRSVKLGKAPLYLTLSNNANYRLMGADLCGQPEVVAEFTTWPRPAGAPLELRPKVYAAVREWQKNSSKSMEQYLREEPTLTAVQKSYLVQQLMYEGNSLPNQDAFTPSAINPLIGPVPSGPRSSNSCRCTIIRLSHTYQVSPFSHIRNNGNRRDIYGVYGSNQDNQDVGGGNVKIWSGWGMEGPSRWNALTAQSNSCPRAPFTATWNAEVNDELEVANFDIEGSQVEQALPNIAVMEFNYLCIDRDNNPTDTNCECEEDKTVRIQAQYHSLTKTKAQVLDGGFLCGSKRNAAAEAIDFAMLSVGSPFNENNPNGVGDFQNVAVSLNGSATDCGSYFTGPTIVDFLELAYYVYNFTQSGKKIETGIGPVDDAIKVGFQTYYANNVFEKLKSKFDGPWRQYTGECGGDQQGRSAAFQLLDSNGDTRPTIGGTGIVNFTAKFNVNKPVTVMISSGATMRVGGQRKWKADASVLSSFRLASVILATPSTNDEGEPEQCCTPGMASYLLSAISGDDTSSGVTENAWRSLTQSFFSSWGFNDFRVRQDDELGDYIRNSSSCNNDIVVEPPSKSLKDQNQVISGISTFNALTELINENQDGEVSIFDISGKRIWHGNSLERIGMGSLSNLGFQLPSGIYIARVSIKNGPTNVAKIVHTRQ